jgi:hypothetical protein
MQTHDRELRDKFRRPEILPFNVLDALTCTVKPSLGMTIVWL